MKLFLTILVVFLVLALEAFIVGWLGFGLSLQALLGHYSSHTVVLNDGQLAWNFTKGIVCGLAFFPLLIWTAILGFFGAAVKSLR